MRIAAYIRVSTDEQVDKGNSLLEQQERLTAYCTAMGWQKPTFYIDDGYSAGTLKRPAIEKLFKDIDKGHFDIVLTSKLDRLCRNLLDLLQTIEHFSKHNCSYVSASESFDTSTAVGRMTLQLLGTFAEFERERTRERVKDNMKSIARNTNRAISGACFGYDIVDGKYVINEEEAEHVRYMFDLAEEGHGHRMIAKKLNDRGVTTKRGKLWDQTNVKRLLRTETISGIRVYNKRKTENGKTVMRPESEWIISENNHPAIIDPDRFQKVQELMKARGRGRKHADSETYILTGLIKCGYCGRNMKGQTSRFKRSYGDYTYYRYICSSYVAGYGCKHHVVHRDDIENAILEKMKYVATVSLKELKELKIKTASKEDEIQEIEARIERVNRRMQRQIEAYENELITAEDLKSASERIQEERRLLQGNLESLKAKGSDLNRFRDKVKQSLDDLTGMDRLKAKRKLRELIYEISVTDGVADIVCLD